MLIAKVKRLDVFSNGGLEVALKPSTTYLQVLFYGKSNKNFKNSMKGSPKSGRSKPSYSYKKTF